MFGLSWFLVRLSTPAWKWHEPQDWTPSLPTCMSQNRALPRTSAAGPADVGPQRRGNRRACRPGRRKKSSSLTGASSSVICSSSPVSDPARAAPRRTKAATATTVPFGGMAVAAGGVVDDQAPVGLAGAEVRRHGRRLVRRVVWTGHQVPDDGPQLSRGVEGVGRDGLVGIEQRPRLVPAHFPVGGAQAQRLRR